MLLDPIGPQTVVRGPILPPATDGSYALAPLVLVLLVVSVLVWVQRRRIRASAPRRAGVMASFALSVALGNALVELNAMLDATRPAVMEVERGIYDRDADGVGDGRWPSEWG
jgi:hypothetical protein